jgi:serine/threonine-protein kinase HipA
LTASSDAHARNYAVLLDGDHVRLAPVFDVASGLAYGTSGDGRRILSMSVAGEFDADRVDREAWVRFAGENGLDEGRVLGRVGEIARAVPEAMADALAEVDDWDGAASELGARLLPAVRKHTVAVVRGL